MSFEHKEAELGLLLPKMQNEPHELHEQIALKLSELKAYGCRCLTTWWSRA